MRWRSLQREAQPHYVRDYRRHVSALLRAYPRDEAMSLAIGGNSEQGGDLQVDVLVAAGLSNRTSLVDLGCGSGRLSKALGRRFPSVEYLGTDVVDELIDYARQGAPRSFRFELHSELSIPAASGSIDIVCAFSLFTHLFHEETVCYLQDARRCLRPGGCVVFSFLEYGRHWDTFEPMLRDEWRNARPHLNMFIERSAIAEWSRHLGYSVETYDFPSSLGQSIVLLRLGF